MPNKQKPILFLRDKLAEMLRETSSVSKSVFTAAALLLICTALTLTVVIGLKQGQPYSAKADNLAAVTKPEQKPAVEIQVQPQSQTLVQSSAETVPLTSPKPQVQPKPEVETSAITLGAAQRPLKGATIVKYGWQEHPLFKDWRFHSGIDIAAVEGAVVTAVWPGEVKEIFQDKIAGLTVAIVSNEYTVYYGSLATVEVRKGTKIKAGAIIGAVGASRAEPYPHLHLAVKKGGNYIDPAEKF